MIAKQAGGAVAHGHQTSQYPCAVGPAVDQVAQQDDAVESFQFELLQQIFKLPVASVDVANGDEPAFHLEREIWLAFENGPAENPGRWN